jgi:HEAT repeat protein
VALSVALAFLAGCGADKPDPRTGRLPGPSRQPPAYPAVRNVPLDPRLRSDAENELVSALRASDPEVRAHAIEAFQDAGGVGHTADIVRAMGDPDPLVRYAACLAAGQLKLKDAHSALFTAASDKDPAVRVAARFGLHQIGDYRYSHELEELARDPQPRVRGTTAMVLGMIGDPSALKILQVMRTDAHPAVRQQAAAAMWQLGSEQGLRDVVGWSMSRFPDDEMVGLLSLATPRHHDVIQHVRSDLVSDWPDVSLTAARAMGMLGSDEGYGIAQQGAKSSDSRERIEAAMAFGAIGRSDAQDVLKKLLHDQDPNVRVASASAILQLKPDYTPLP